MATFIHDPKRFIFVHVPKTGGMSVTRLFAKNNRDPILREYSPKNERLALHAGLSEVVARLGETFRDYFSFGFVRNPWDLQVSMYHYIARTAHHPFHERVKGASFDVWVREILPEFDRPHQCQLLSVQGRFAVSRYFRYEDFERSVEYLTERLELDIQPTLPHHNRTKDRGHYRDYYTPELRRLVESRFEEDCRAFGYVF